MSTLQKFINDVSKTMKVIEIEEKDAQEEYDNFMSDSAAKRSTDAQSMRDAASDKTELKGDEETTRAEKKSTTKDLAAATNLEHELHLDCDFLIKFYDVRKEARGDEIDSLKKAKAVLSGADFSLAQTGAARLRASRSRSLKHFLGMA